MVDGGLKIAGKEGNSNPLVATAADMHKRSDFFIIVLARFCCDIRVVRLLFL